MMLKPASEGSIVFADKQAALADRKQFVENLGWLLAQTREGVEKAYLDDKDTVHVVFCKGGELRVNVQWDSYMAIIRDVAKALR
jgi:hypothetical protein